MKITRRAFVNLSMGFALGASASNVFGQGMSNHVAKPQSRMPPSGRPFHAKFTDVAKEAGLIEPVIYGQPEHKDYILEATGCGCAFFDYDNDGWINIFLLSGTRMDGPPTGATNRLYKNNRDGTFTDVTDKAGLREVGWAGGVCVGDYNNDGFEDLFCSYFGQNPTRSGKWSIRGGVGVYRDWVALGQSVDQMRNNPPGLIGQTFTSTVNVNGSAVPLIRLITVRIKFTGSPPSADVKALRAIINRDNRHL